MPLPASFLKLLKGRPQWERYTGDDSWGNNVYASPETIEAFVGTTQVASGAQDGQGVQEQEEVYTVDLITDYKGIKVKDRMTIDARPMYVESAEVVHDAFGAPLYQNVTLTTRKRG